MSPGMAAALDRFKPKGAAPGDLIFEVSSPERLAEIFRGHLTLAGVDRPELTTRTKTRSPTEFATFGQRSSPSRWRPASQRHGWPTEAATSRAR